MTTLIPAAAFSSPALAAAPRTRPRPVAALRGKPATAVQRNLLAVAGTPDPAPVLSDDRGRAREPAPPPGTACSARIITGTSPVAGYDCAAAPARWFTAACRCGHQIAGWGCGGCLDSGWPGCFSCWTQPEDRHKCRVTFTGEQQ